MPRWSLVGGAGSLPSTRLFCPSYEKVCFDLRAGESRARAVGAGRQVIPGVMSRTRSTLARRSQLPDRRPTQTEMRTMTMGRGNDIAYGYHHRQPLSRKLTIRFFWGASLLGAALFLHHELKSFISFSSLPCLTYQHDSAMAMPTNEASERRGAAASILTDLIHLYDTIPNATFSATSPPFREVSYAYMRRKPPPSEHITLVTQISVTKFARVLNLLERWNGPVSCAVYLPSPPDIEKLHHFIRGKDRALLDRVTFHVLLERPTPESSYPINRLRNLALHGIDTDFFFNCDVDFMPSVNAHDNMVQFLALPPNAKRRFSTLWVLPAFERFPEAPAKSVETLALIPETKRELLSLLSQHKKIQPFHIDYFPLGHEPTNFDKWYKCPEGETYPANYSYYFEPYVVGNRYGIPNYIDLFRGFGTNKASWFADAHFAGYRFEVLCTHFVVHMNHPGRETRRLVSAPLKWWFLEQYLPGRYNASKVAPQRTVLPRRNTQRKKQRDPQRNEPRDDAQRNKQRDAQRGAQRIAAPHRRRGKMRHKPAAQMRMYAMTLRGR